MSHDPVEKLSKTQQRRSLGEASKKEKLSTRKPIRTTVVNPNELEWADVDEETAIGLLDIIAQAMKCLKLPARSVPLQEIRKIRKEERREFRKQWVAEKCLEQSYQIANYTLYRSQLAIGVNRCSAGMEIDKISGLVIEKDVSPSIITRLLVPIAKTRRVPLISVSGLRKTMKEACNISCIALGLKAECRNKTSPFYHVLQYIFSHAPSTETHVEDNSSSDELSSSTSVLPSSSLAATPAESTKISTEQVERKVQRKRELERSFSKSDLVPPKIRKVNPNTSSV